MVGANPGGQCASGPRRRPRRRRPHPIRSIPALAVTHDRTAEPPGAERGATIAAGLWNDAATGNGGGCPSRGSQGLALTGQYQLSTDAADIGRASCRGRVCPHVYISVVADTLKNKITT